MNNQDRLKPPLRPPLPKRMLGGTNFNEDMVEVRWSISALLGALVSKDGLSGGSEAEDPGEAPGDPWGRLPLVLSDFCP